jgi:hydrogenase maturation protease
MRALFIGVGNDHRRDDAVGLHVARRLLELRPPGLEIIEQRGDLTRMLDLWSAHDLVFVVDAARSGGEPGSIHRFELPEERLPESILRTSTHQVGVGEALGLARTLGRLPPRLIVYGIEGADFGHGDRLTPAVGEAAKAMVDRVLRELSG